MQSFVTGSRAYGTPRGDSDIDLVVLVSMDDMKLLIAVAGEYEGNGAKHPHYEDGVSLRFGDLNLLCVAETKHFDVWKQGTEELKKVAPVTRDHAIAFLAELRRKNKIEGW